MTPVVALRGPRQVGKTTLIQQIIQHLLDEGVPWAPQLKHLVDMSAVRVMITGSSALKIAKAQDSLAGRVSTIEMGPLFLREIAAFRGWDELPPFIRPFNGLAQLKTQKFCKICVNLDNNIKPYDKMPLRHFLNEARIQLPIFILMPHGKKWLIN